MLTCRSLGGVLPEGIPVRYRDIDVERDRKRRDGGMRFIPQDIMGTAIGGSEEIFRIRYNKGFCEFGITGAHTMRLVALIFKALVPHWHVIVRPFAGRDVTNVIEFSTTREWEPD
jgi:hypothetical protein